MPAQSVADSTRRVCWLRRAISETKPFIGGQSIKREYAGRSAVWYVTTDLSTWTMRQGRQVMLTGNSYGWCDEGGKLPPGVTRAVNPAGQPELVCRYGGGVTAIMASPTAARLAGQSRRGEVTVSWYGWAPSEVPRRATSSSTCSFPVPGRW